METCFRLGSALEVAELLQQCLAHLQQPTAVALPQSLAKPATSRIVSGRRYLPWLAAAVLAVAAIVGGAVDSTLEPNHRGSGWPATPSVEGFSDRDVTGEVNRFRDDLTPLEQNARHDWD